MKSAFCKVLTICLIAVAAYSHAETTDKPDVHVGDRWSWQHTNGLVNERDVTRVEDVVGISDNEIKTRVRIKGKSGSDIYTYTRDWNPVDIVSAQWTPYLKRFVFPLEVGKKWDGAADKMVFKGGKHGKFSLTGEVVAFEKVTVPAGTFDAYKIKLTTDAVSTDEDVISGHTEETCWYAPAVRQNVKCEDTFSRDGRVRTMDIDELLEFNLR